MISATKFLIVTRDIKSIAHHVKRKKVFIRCYNLDNCFEKDVNRANDDIETSTIINSDEILIERSDNIEVFLPSYQIDDIYPKTEWHTISGKDFVDFINTTYDDIIHWRKNLFKLPTSKASRLFISELTSG